MFERRGAWAVPAWYGSVDEEVAALNTTLGFADVSARGKVKLSGAVEAMVRRLTGSSAEPQRTAPMAAGGGTVARITRDWALALLPPSGEGDLLSELDEEPVDDAIATDMTSGMSAFLVAGPRLEEFLARTLSLDLVELVPGRCAAAGWARIPTVVVMLDLPSPAAELYVVSDHGRYAWGTIDHLGSRLGGLPVGWGALETWGWR